jgi:hypothetical protein
MLVQKPTGNTDFLVLLHMLPKNHLTILIFFSFGKLVQKQSGNTFCFVTHIGRKPSGNTDLF